jgi:membrane protein implicated in regulation of membrane protease activity
MDFVTRLLLMLGLAAAAVGAIDAVVGDDADQLAIFVLIGLLLVAVWARQRVSRRNVTLRPDLAHWLDDRAQATGEPFDDVLDRAVATYRHGLHVDR